MLKARNSIDAQAGRWRHREYFFWCRGQGIQSGGRIRRCEAWRGRHPNSKNWFLLKSVDQIAEYSSYDHVDMISPRPLLMIAGTNADTRFFSEMAIEEAKEPKELFLIEGATHVDLYDKKQY